MGLKQGYPLSATLFGLFIDGLRHHLQTLAQQAGMQVLFMRVGKLVHADEWYLMAASRIHLQALIDALATYCRALHTEISDPKTVMVVSHAHPLSRF